MTNLQVICPQCSSRGKINVSSKVVKDSSRGLFAINVPQNAICTHSFIIYLDNNLNIRDYFMADFLLKLPEIESTEHVKDIILTEENLSDLSLVKLNISANLMTYIIKSILSKKNILLILNESFMKPLILDFFRIITQDNFSFNISIMSVDEYDNSINNFKNYIVCEGSKIINDPDGLLSSKNIGIEKKIVHNFLSEIEFDSSILMLRNEFQKAFLFTNSILEQVKNIKKIEKVNITKLAKNLEKIHNIKISDDYFEFLLNIVREYFKVNIPSALENFFTLL